MGKAKNSDKPKPGRVVAQASGGFAATVASALGAIGTPRSWRIVLSGVVGLLVAAACQGGLITFAPWWQVGGLAGLATGLIAPNLVGALVTGGVAAGVAGLIGPENSWMPFDGSSDRAIAALTAAVMAAAAAGAARYVIERRWLSPKVIMWFAVALLIGNMWATTLASNAEGAYDPMTQAQMPSFNEQLAGQIPPAVADSDDAWFYRIVGQMRDGAGYYEAMHAALLDNDNWVGSSPITYRLPTAFWAFSALPSAALPIAFLVVASCAILAIPFVSIGVVRAPVSLVAAALLASYFVYFPVQLTLFSQEQWSVALAVIAAAAFGRALQAERYRTLTVVAVVAAVSAALVRETAVFVVLAGLASALVVPSARRRFEAIAWGAGLAAFAALYAAHWVRASSILESASQNVDMARGGVGFALAALEYATDMLGAGGPWPYVFAVLGIIGIALVPDVRLRVFGLLAGVAPLAVFLFVGNRAWYASTGGAINYWGGTVVALVYAFVPLALIVVPGAASSPLVQEGRK